MQYVAVTYAGNIAIGDFPSDSQAFNWALERYGADLISVAQVPTDQTSGTGQPYATDPVPFAALTSTSNLLLLGVLGLVVLGGMGGKK